MTDNDCIVETFNLTKFYGKTRGIENLNLTVNRGEVFGFLGPNGAGKTTTIRLLLNLIFPTSGTAKIFGLDFVKQSELIKRKIGYVPGNISIYNHLTGKEYLDLIAAISNRSPLLRKEMLEKFPVDLNKKIKELSFGNKRKLMLIGAMQFENELLLLDEPTIGLDPLAQRAFYETIEVLREKGVTVFLSSHNLPEVERICDRVGMVFNGRLVSLEKIEELHSKKIKLARVKFKEVPETSRLKNPDWEMTEINGSEVSFKIKGKVDEFIKKLSEFHIDDITISHPSLEDFFMEFYVKGKA